ncbi:MAG: hypothetical protein AMJ42_04680 [Deltaproteobacteria bacterium DG_8]|nr:MAG: hypothetical protein AMJ42_04680 [Deltaproteobacteria bacterium DG_8]
MTILNALQWGIDQLQDSKVDNPRLDAEILLAHCLHRDRVKLYVFYDKLIDREERKRYMECIERRVKREPVAYIIGYKEFRSLCFKVTQAVLIPRPETEVLVEEILKEYGEVRKKRNVIRILELGTGSGIVAVSLAKEIERLSIVATDISLEVLEVARENARVHKEDSKINFIVGRFLQPIRVSSHHFDFIVSNPPYLSQSDWKNVQPEIKEYEAPDFLFGGQDGLDFYRALMPDVSKLLNYDGWLVLEVGIGQAEKVSNMIKNTGEFKKVKLVKDLSGISRVVKAQKRMVTI